MTSVPRRHAPPLFVGARHAVPVRRPRHKRTPTVNLNPLEAALTELAVTIANKGLTWILSLLDATLTEYHGGAL